MGHPKKYVVVHGHFYQPPRENAWLDEIEVQESAAPYHDWNMRITDECYGPNALSRILDNSGQIVDIVNNYVKISFNFGPTLLSWMEKHNPIVYDSILEADKQSVKLYDGHGSAMAQVYNHIIMPLADRRDKETQVKWGIRDFESRFNRKPEGMWLAETAVDTESLEVLAENDIRFTVLAPYQAKRFRKKGDKAWTNGIDTRRPYKCSLPSGKHIYLFFYDGDRSQGVAFNGYLNDGKHFANELLSGFSNESFDQVVHIATDGESYGHHHRKGEMALSYCIREIETRGDIEVVNYSYLLDKMAVEYEVEINENTSWSCAHGVERWRSNCGCHTGGEPGWNQAWRKPLRDALDHLNGKLQTLYETEVSKRGVNPSLLRNEYIEVLLNRDQHHVNKFLSNHFGEELSDSDKTHVLRLLEMQKNALFMYTSCGWFFTELSGLETIQILQYAERAIQLAERESEIKLSESFKEDLSLALSNLEMYGSGRTIFEKQVEPKRLTLTQVGIHYAVMALLREDADEPIDVLNYTSESKSFSKKKAGSYVLLTGRTKVSSRVTFSIKEFSFALLYLGNHHLIGSAGSDLSEEEFTSVRNEIFNSFEQGNIAASIDSIKKHFSEKSFSFFNLVRDVQLMLLDEVISAYKTDLTEHAERVYRSSFSLMKLMRAENLAVPDSLRWNLETVFQTKLEEMLNPDDAGLDLLRMERYVNDSLAWRVNLDTEKLAYLSGRKFYAMTKHFDPKTDQKDWFNRMEQGYALIRKLNVDPDVYNLQNLVYRLVCEEQKAGKQSVDLDRFAALLNFNVESIRKRMTA